MKKARLCFLLFVFIFPVLINAQQTVKVAIGEWRPYTSENLKHYGVVSRIITEAFATQDINVEYGFFPWARALEYTKTGQWNATGVWSYSEEREAFFHYSAPVLEVRTVLFHLKSIEINWEKMEDLKNLTIGATISYNYGDLFENAEKAGILTVERVANDELNFRKLMAGHIDAYVSNETTGLALINRLFTEKQASEITINSKPLAVRYASLLFSRALEESDELMKKFNLGLLELQENGKFDLYFQESRDGKYDLDIQ